MASGVSLSAGTHQIDGVNSSLARLLTPERPGRSLFTTNVYDHTNHPCVPVPVTRFAQPKDIQMIDKKQFVAQPVRTPAGGLAQRHLGSLVTITTPEGAEITDTLFRISSTRGINEVRVELQNVEQSSHHPEWDLDPKSIVLVRRPRPEPKKPAAKKAARR